MHGKLALHQPQYGIIPIAVALLAIIWTTIFLTWIQTYLVADDAEDLALAYLLPTIFIAVFFGSTLAVASSFAARSPLPIFSTLRSSVFILLILRTLRNWALSYCCR